MKEYKTYNQQLGILRGRGLIVPKDGKPKRFLEQENYYNVINGYKDLFLKRDRNNNPLDPEQFIDNAHFNELKALFLFDRELRFLFLKYILIFENSFKTTLSHEFSKKHPKANSYLEIKNYVDDSPKEVLKQMSVLTAILHDKVTKSDAVKHYIEEHGSVPLWVLVNYLTVGNLSYLYKILKVSDKNSIAKCYADKYNKQYKPQNRLSFSSESMQSALKVVNLLRNICAHDERLYNVRLNDVEVARIARYHGLNNIDNHRLIVLIIYLKVVLDKPYFTKMHTELIKIFNKYEKEFNSVRFEDILDTMGINMADFRSLL